MDAGTTGATLEDAGAERRHGEQSLRAPCLHVRAVLRRVRRATLCALSIAAPLFLSSPALGQARDAGSDRGKQERSDAGKAQQARELMRAGLVEWGKGNLEGARDALVKAWDASPNPDIASALAELDMKLGRYREAADYWQVYLVSTPPDYETAQGKLAACRQNLGRLRIHVEPSEAVVTLDTDVVSSSKLDADVLVDPGTHVLRAELRGQATTQQVSIRAGESNALSLVVPTLAQATTAAPPPAGSSTSRSRPIDDGRAGIPAKTVALIGGTALTLAATTIGIVYTVQANHAADDAARFDTIVHSKADPRLTAPNGVCTPPPGVRPPECANLEHAVDDRQRASNVAIGAYIAAGAFAAGTVAAYFLWPASERGRVSLVPMLVGRGVQVKVAF
jgi:tetratricopeptide (TPR) repeat protein